MTKTHSDLAPSASNRWINCSGSFLLPQVEDTHDTTAANEGTLAHRIAELKLTRDLWNDNETELAECRKNPLYKKEMEYYTDEYFKFIHSKSYSECLIETMVDMDNIYPGLYGTCDCILIDEEKQKLEIIDFKYGFGKVPVEMNTQLLLYSLGALNLLKAKFPRIQDYQVILNIYQPRIKNIASFRISPDELKKWRNDVLIPALVKIRQKRIEENAGDWCKYCRAKLFCRKNFKDTNNLVRKITQFSNEEIASNFETINEVHKELAKLIKDSKKYMIDEIESGREIKGYTVAPGRRERKWSNEESVKSLIKELKLDALIPLSPKQLEDLVGKEEFSKTFESLINYKEGAKTLKRKKT